MHRTRMFDTGGGVYAFYDGRVEGYRFAGEPNWVYGAGMPWRQYRDTTLGGSPACAVGQYEVVTYDATVSPPVEASEASRSSFRKQM
jgi:hypothetical protein